MTKLKIDLTNRLIEVEGEQEFVEKIYKDFQNQIKLKGGVNIEKDDTASRVTIKKGKDVGSTITSRRVRGIKENYSIVKDLDLTEKDKQFSLKAFYKEKSPSSFFDKNAVFVYYLKEIAKISNITLDHIFTCYDDVESPKPNAFKQSIADTSSKKGWLETSSFENISISIRGQNRVKHDLPQKNNT
ncbi:MAG: hypothetical protein WC489_01590 [Patescibacteria group bacterium]